jgi:predicted enzyme related to lactoylglutathione lyase
MLNASKGHFVWHEHLTKDPNAAMAFYGQVVGWTTQPFTEGPGYTMLVSTQGPLGGVMKLPDDAAKMGAPPHWMGDVMVDDVDASAALAKKLGGKILREPWDIPKTGRACVLADPQGAVIAIFKPANGGMQLHDASKEGEFCWNELYTTDSAAAFDFYSKLFGWKLLQEMDMGDMGKYRIYGLGDKQLGGMMNIPKGSGMRPGWIFYTETKDLEAAIERAKKNGAKLMSGPMEVPGGGRVAQLTDPQGAAFALHQAPKKN